MYTRSPIPFPEPCGACHNCKLAAEVLKMLEFIDRRYVPDLELLAETISHAKWSGLDRACEAAMKEFRRKRDEWLTQKGKLMTMQVINSMTCAKTLSTIRIRSAEEPRPGELTAQPRDQEPFVRPWGDLRCIRCGRPAEPAVVGSSVCAKCFGRE